MQLDMSDFTLTRDDYFPNPPTKKDYGIGIVGCGGIIRGAHLPAYRKCGYRVLACCDINAGNARAVAEEFGIPHWSSNLEDVLDNPDVDIVDLAVHAAQRPALMERIASHRRRPRAILSQKPFALSYVEAAHMVAQCERAGIVLMVNQQARWAPGHRALKTTIDSGRLGHVFSVLHVNRGFQDDPSAWYGKVPHFNIVDHGIHYIDLGRHFTGQTPRRVKATTVMAPGQAAVSPMIYSILCEYEPSAQLMTTLHFNNIVSVAETLGRYEWFVDGTEGSAWLSYSELAVAFKSAPGEKHTVPIEGAWFPDAFSGSMGELMQALTDDRVPLTNGRDNLQSLKVALAAVESSETGEAVSVSNEE